MRGMALADEQRVFAETVDVCGSDAARDERWATERRRIETGRYWVSPAGPRRRWSNTAFRAALCAFTCAMRLAGLYEYGRRGALAPQLTDLTLSFPALPRSFDGYRILHLTDTHLDILPELADVAHAMLAGVEVDALALTGDVLGRHDAPLTSAIEPLVHILDAVSVRGRRLAVLGNHDPAEMAKALAALGFEVLLNRSVELERGGERVIVTGVDDVHSFYTDAARDALVEPGAAGFRVALVHSPEIADHASAAGIALYLCGHTHGGQICLPSGKPFITQLTRCHQAAKGLWHYGAMKGYTSSGLGTNWPPLRVNCRGEMTLITLRAGDQNSHDYKDGVPLPGTAVVRG